MAVDCGCLKRVFIQETLYMEICLDFYQMINFILECPVSAIQDDNTVISGYYSVKHGVQDLIVCQKSFICSIRQINDWITKKYESFILK